MGAFEQYPILFLGLAFAAGFAGGLSARVVQWLRSR